MWWQEILWCAFCVNVAKEEHADMLGFLNKMHNLRGGGVTLNCIMLSVYLKVSVHSTVNKTYNLDAQS